MNLKGIYQPYTTEQAASLVAKIKANVPRWVRIMRVQRDIPAQLIVAGIKKGNLREMVKNEMQKLGLLCRCIRCREVGHRMLFNDMIPNIDDVKIVVPFLSSLISFAPVMTDYFVKSHVVWFIVKGFVVPCKFGVGVGSYAVFTKDCKCIAFIDQSLFVDHVKIEN